MEHGSETDFGLGVRGSVPSVRGSVPMDRVFGREDGRGSGALSRAERAGSLNRSFPASASWTELNADAVVPVIRLGDGAARTYVGGVDQLKALIGVQLVGGGS